METQANLCGLLDDAESAAERQAHKIADENVVLAIGMSVEESSSKRTNGKEKRLNCGPWPAIGLSRFIRSDVWSMPNASDLNVSSLKSPETDDFAIFSFKFYPISCLSASSSCPWWIFPPPPFLFLFSFFFFFKKKHPFSPTARGSCGLDGLRLLALQLRGVALVGLLLALCTVEKPKQSASVILPHMYTYIFSYFKLRFRKRLASSRPVHLWSSSNRCFPQKWPWQKLQSPTMRCASALQSVREQRIFLGAISFGFCF